MPRNLDTDGRHNKTNRGQWYPLKNTKSLGSDTPTVHPCGPIRTHDYDTPIVWQPIEESPRIVPGRTPDSDTINVNPERPIIIDYWRNPATVQQPGAVTTHESDRTSVQLPDAKNNQESGTENTQEDNEERNRAIRDLLCVVCKCLPNLIRIIVSCVAAAGGEELNIPDIQEIMDAADTAADIAEKAIDVGKAIIDVANAQDANEKCHTPS